MARAFLLKLVEFQDGRCACCGGIIDHLRAGMDDGEWPSEDHVVARGAGGGDHELNKVAMHRRCNSGKNHRFPTGCELIYHALVLAKLEIEKETVSKFINTKSGATFADIWPT